MHSTNPIGRVADPARPRRRPNLPLTAPVPLGTVPVPSAAPSAIERARAAYASYERRILLLGAGLFADPAWNMLLDLFISEADGRRLSVSAVCIGSRSSSATASRYLALLVEAGLVRRTADGRDKRRTYVDLTEIGRERLLACLAAEVPFASV